MHCAHTLTHIHTYAQLVVRGIPWSYTWKELKDMFAEVAGVEHADVVYGDDGRSRVRVYLFVY
jgi:RNA recognition motif-containing protein